MLIWMSITLQHEKRNGWTVKCSTWDSGVTGLSLKGATALCPWARHFFLYLVQNMGQKYYYKPCQLGKEYTNIELLHGKTNNSFQKVLSEAFLVDEGRENPNTTKAGHHRPISETPFNGVSLAGLWWPNIECWLGSFVIFHRIRTSFSKKPYIFVNFHGGSEPRICTQ